MLQDNKTLFTYFFLYTGTKKKTVLVGYQ